MHPSSSPRDSANAPPTASYDPDQSVRTHAVVASAQARLGPVCANWPPEQFSALISDVVRFRERWNAVQA